MNSLTFVAVCCVKCHRAAVAITWWATKEWCEHGAPCSFTTAERNICKDGCIANARGECIAVVGNAKRLAEFLAA